MNYELAKELKDAGFPKKMIGACKRLNDPSHPDCRVDREDCQPEMIGPPTLSELIEACGDGLEDLRRDGDGWAAIANLTYEGTFDPDISLYGSGPAPEEAVAKLWLALNKTP